MPTKKKTSKKKTTKKKVALKKVVKKPSSKKKAVKKETAKKTIKKPSPKTSRIKGIGSAKPNSKFYHTKFNLVTKQIILFAILFIISILLFGVSENLIYKNLFFLLSIIFGFIIVAFFIVLLVFLFLRAMNS